VEKSQGKGAGSGGTKGLLPVDLQHFAAKGPSKAKTGSKPFGTGPHNEKIAEVARKVRDGRIIAGGQLLPEKAIPTPNGLKSSRRPDILVEKPDGSIYGINVGKTTKSGAPIKREMESINDLEDVGIPMHFVPYSKK